MRLLFLKLSAVVCLFQVGSVFATPEEQLELKELELTQEKLNLQKDWIKYRFEKSKNECYSKFFTNSCLRDAKEVHDKEVKNIRVQEIPMHDRQRELKESLKNQRDEERNLEKRDPKHALEREKNRRVYEEKQADRAQREKDLEERRQDAQKRSQENRSSSPF